jgi:hypothetical protein
MMNWSSNPRTIVDTARLAEAVIYMGRPKTPKLGCSVCGRMKNILSKDMKYLHKAAPLICGTDCLLTKIRSLTEFTGRPNYIRTNGALCIGEGTVYSRRFRIAFRSKYELKVAEFLADNGLKFEYERYLFKLGWKTYTPDFYIRQYDCFIEVKGLWMMGGRRKMYLFYDGYPDVNLIIVPWTMRSAF